jgi:pimeloyl-ACP methyl ester carboxylesterase
VGIEALPMPHVEGVRHRLELVDGARLHIAEAGSGPPLILLHGWPQHWFSWRAVIAPLAQCFRVVIPDIRGMGWSDGPGSDWSFEQLASDVRSLMELLRLDRAAVVGHDWGAAIGYQLCLDHPERVTRFMPLAALHPWSGIGARPRLLLRPWHLYLNALAAPIANTRLGVPGIALRNWRHAGAFSPVETEIYLGPLRLPTAIQATSAYYRNLVVREMPHFLRHARQLRLKVQTLHLNGAEDPLTRRMPDSWRTFADDMQCDLIRECGHFLAEERPDELTERMLDFFGAEV